MLAPFALSYSASVHSTTGFSPAFLPCGFQPIMPGSVLARTDSHHDITIACTQSKSNDYISSEATVHSGREERHKEEGPYIPQFENAEAEHFTKVLEHHGSRAKNAIKFAQGWMEQGYNQGRTVGKVCNGDLVLMDVHGLRLTHKKDGVGRKLLPKYNGPFEVMEVISLVGYHLRLPATYQIHRVINQEHLEWYHSPTSKFGHDCPKKPFQREHFDMQPEFEIKRIEDEKLSCSQHGRWVCKYMSDGQDMTKHMMNGQLVHSWERCQWCCTSGKMEIRQVLDNETGLACG